MLRKTPEPSGVFCLGLQILRERLAEAASNGKPAHSSAVLGGIGRGNKKKKCPSRGIFHFYGCPPVDFPDVFHVIKGKEKYLAGQRRCALIVLWDISNENVFSVFGISAGVQ